MTIPAKFVPVILPLTWSGTEIFDNFIEESTGPLVHWFSPTHHVIETSSDTQPVNRSRDALNFGPIFSRLLSLFLQYSCGLVSLSRAIAWWPTRSRTSRDIFKASLQPEIITSACPQVASQNAQPRSRCFAYASQW